MVYNKQYQTLLIVHIGSADKDLLLAYAIYPPLSVIVSLADPLPPLSAILGICLTPSPP